ALLAIRSSVFRICRDCLVEFMVGGVDELGAVFVGFGTRSLVSHDCAGIEVIAASAGRIGLRSGLEFGVGLVGITSIGQAVSEAVVVSSQLRRLTALHLSGRI